MRKHIQCGTLFTAVDDKALKDQTVIIEDGRIARIVPTDSAPQPEAGDEVVDHSRHFVMPGLTDIHVHLSYGNAKSEEGHCHVWTPPVMQGKN